MPIPRLDFSEVNTVQALTGNGADMSNLGMKGFEPVKPAVSLSKPTIEMGGPSQ